MFTLEEYPQVLVEEFDLPRLKQGDVQVVFRPSFHVECAITLSRERLDFRTFDGSMWLYLNAFGVEPDKTLRELLAEGNCAIERTRPFLVSVERRLQPDAATSVLEKLPTAELDKPEGRVVIDGMPVWIDVMGEDEQWRLWDGVPATDSPSSFDCFGFLRSLLSCAREVLRMPLCVHRLESLEEYIHEKENPFLDSGGDPRVVQLTGQSRWHCEALEHLLVGLDEDRVVVDMTGIQLLPGSARHFRQLFDGCNLDVSVVAEPITVRALWESEYESLYPTVASAIRHIDSPDSPRRPESGSS